MRSPSTSYAHASSLEQHRLGRRLRGVCEAAICGEIGHDMRPVADGRVACVCCGIPGAVASVHESISAREGI